MILYELTETENNPIYRDLEISNGARQYDFLRSIISCAKNIGRPLLSHEVIKALNYHAIVCLHTSAGQYRPCAVSVGNHNPPEFYRVQALMDDFVDQINRYWEVTDPIALASWALWRMNYVHPFINGNGRTARAVAYFILCLKVGGLLPGEKILPQLLKENRTEYVTALQTIDASLKNGKMDLSSLINLLTRLIQEQITPSTLKVTQSAEASF